MDGEHQAYGIGGRPICNILHVARSVLDDRPAQFCRVAMLQIEFEKAFHRVNHVVFLFLGCYYILVVVF